MRELRNGLHVMRKLRLCNASVATSPSGWPIVQRLMNEVNSRSRLQVTASSSVVTPFKCRFSDAHRPCHLVVVKLCWAEAEEVTGNYRNSFEKSPWEDASWSNGACRVPTGRSNYIQNSGNKLRIMIRFNIDKDFTNKLYKKPIQSRRSGDRCKIKWKHMIFWQRSSIESRPLAGTHQKDSYVHARGVLRPISDLYMRRFIIMAKWQRTDEL